MRIGIAAIVAMTLPLAAVAQNPPRTTPLNRTVIVVPNPAATVPVECEEGLAPQPQPRVTAEERAAVAPVPVPQAPPSRDLRGTLQAALDAVQRNDRATFRERLSRAKEILGSYPTGAERNAAADVVATLDDINTLWDYEFSSPTGAFFDASSDIHRMLEKYSGYEAAMRRQVVVDQNGARFYPTSESRAFLANEAAARMATLTGHAVATVPKPQPREAPAVVERVPVRRKSARPVEHQHHPRRAATANKPRPKPAPVHKRVEKAEAAPKPKPAHAQRPAAAPATPAPSPAAPVSTASAAPPPPIATAPVTTTTAPPPAATETTQATQTTASSSTQPAASSHTNLILPIVLIIAGVGLLVLFSRSSAS